MADAQTMPLADKLDDAGALFRPGAGAGLGGTAVSGSPNRRRPRAGRRALPDAGGRRGARGAPRRCRLSRPISTACRHATARPAWLRQSRGVARAPDCASTTLRKARTSRWSPAATPASSPWPRGLRGDRGRAGRAGDGSSRRSCRGSPRCWRWRRGSARRSATISARISLSDNLKPWELIEARLDAAAAAGFVIALYNPVSQARPWQLGAAFERLRRALPPRRR